VEHAPFQGRRLRAGASLRIALVAPPFLPVPPPAYGGIERVVAMLADGLVARGHEVTLFAGPGSRTRARLVVPLDAAPLLGDPASSADEQYHAAAAFVAAEQFDLVHDHTSLGPLLGAMLYPRVPVVHTLHGPWTAPSKRLLGLLDGRVHFVAISDAQRRANLAVRYSGMIYNGVDLAAHPFRAKKERFLVYVGRVSPEKRPELAIDIARLAGLPLTMIVKRSEPAEQAYWDHVVLPRLGADVEVLDQPPHDVKVDVIGRAQAMIFPIDWPEPFGLVMTESMACGTPVVARPLGAAPEVVEEGVTGFLRSTIAGMAEAVGEARRLSPYACRARAERLFSADVMVDSYERLYRTIAGIRADERAPSTDGLADGEPGAVAHGRLGPVLGLPAAG
jgi:glycosyltransferase involved in cell wall biosynthesis